MLKLNLLNLNPLNFNSKKSSVKSENKTFADTYLNRLKKSTVRKWSRGNKIATLFFEVKKAASWQCNFVLCCVLHRNIIIKFAWNEELECWRRARSQTSGGGGCRESRRFLRSSLLRWIGLILLPIDRLHHTTFSGPLLRRFWRCYCTARWIQLHHVEFFRRFWRLCNVQSIRDGGCF